VSDNRVPSTGIKDFCNLLSRMNTFKDVVVKLEDAIKRNDKEKLIELLTQAKTERDRWMT